MPPAGTVFESFAKDRDRTSKAAFFDECVSPDVLQQILLLNDIARVLHQKQQSVGGLPRKGDGPVIAEKDTSRWVQAEAPESIEMAVRIFSHGSTSDVRSR